MERRVERRGVKRIPRQKEMEKLKSCAKASKIECDEDGTTRMMCGDSVVVSGVRVVLAFVGSGSKVRVRSRRKGKGMNHGFESRGTGVGRKGSGVPVSSRQFWCLCVRVVRLLCECRMQTCFAKDVREQTLLPHPRGPSCYCKNVGTLYPRVYIYIYISYGRNKWKQQQQRGPKRDAKIARAESHS